MRLLHKSLVVDSLTLLLFISATFCSVLAFFSLLPFYVELFIKYTGQRNSVQVPQVSKTWLTTPIIKTLLMISTGEAKLFGKCNRKDQVYNHISLSQALMTNISA